MSEAGRPDESRVDARLFPFGRLTKRRDFLAAAAGRRFHTERMTVQGRLRGDDAEGMRIGFTLTKRVGNAVERNRIKRRLRAAVRELGSAALESAASPRRKDAEAAAAVISPCHKGDKGGTRQAEQSPMEASQPFWPSLAADIVVIGRRPAIEAPFDALVADLARALPKVTKPGDPAKRDRARDGRGGSQHRRRGRGGGTVTTGQAPSRHS
ncbi:MAG: ribonuclease P protein component [Salinarimonas sp.]|nr:ribonuclease P protein component [Salinarimonas sp.]